MRWREFGAASARFLPVRACNVCRFHLRQNEANEVNGRPPFSRLQSLGYRGGRARPAVHDHGRLQRFWSLDLQRTSPYLASSGNRFTTTVWTSSSLLWTNATRPSGPKADGIAVAPAG